MKSVLPSVALVYLFILSHANAMFCTVPDTVYGESWNRVWNVNGQTYDYDPLESQLGEEGAVWHNFHRCCPIHQTFTMLQVTVASQEERCFSATDYFAEHDVVSVKLVPYENGSASLLLYDTEACEGVFWLFSRCKGPWTPRELFPSLGHITRVKSCMMYLVSSFWYMAL